MNAKDIVKIETLLQGIRHNFPKVKINYCVNMDHSAFLAINKKVFFFRGTKEMVRTIVFLVNAKFSPKAIEILLKEKTTKKKEFFLYWVANCVNYGHQKGRTLEDLRQEFNTLYGLEIKQGRKKRTKEGTHSTECQE
jgi:hypothetical protein